MRHALITLFVVFALTACGGGGDGDAHVATVQVGGSLAGLGTGKSVVIADASGQTASLSANGRYSLNIPTGTAYNLRIQTQPLGQTCVVANGAGTATAAIDNITVTCTDNAVSPDAKTVSGTVAGMGAGKAVVLQLTANGVVQETTVNADGSFQFPQPVTGTYTITVKTQPGGQSCTVGNSQGTAGDGSVVAVSCAVAGSSFKLGGTVSGNLGVVALRNASNGDTVAINTNGTFSFTQPVLAGGRYEVVVLDQSASQICSVTGGAGTASADVLNIQVSCAAVVVALPPPLAPDTPAGLTMTYYVKSFNLAWGTVTTPDRGGSVTFRVFEDVDGAGPAAGAQIATGLAGTTYTHAIPALLHTRLNAQYTVQACNSGGCSTPTAAITPNLAQAIGYFKASNTEFGDSYGESISLSGDGNTLALGAYQEGSNATGINGDQSNNGAGGSGAVYVYTKSGGTWSQQAYVKASNTRPSHAFGRAVALSGDGSTLVVGAINDNSNATGINGDQSNTSAGSSGAAYVFVRSGGTWSQQAYVKASNTRTGANFGRRVAMSSDGNTMAISSPLETSAATGVNGNQADTSAANAGAVYVFTRSGVTWSQQAYVKASNTQGGDQFGNAVALSRDGDTLAVGATGEASNATGISGNEADNSMADAGAVYVFARSAGTWSQQAYVKASNTRASAAFGGFMALSGNGSTMAVGAIGDSSNATGVNGNQADASASGAGAVYVFTRTAGTWSQEAYVKASNTQLGDRFGPVALSADGNTLAVGAWSEDSLATGIDGDQFNDQLGSFHGAAYLFTRSAGTWSQRAYLKATASGGNIEFGWGVSLSDDGNTLAVAAVAERSNATGINGDQTNTSASFSGAAYLY
jgi:hypothetical protein